MGVKIMHNQTAKKTKERIRPFPMNIGLIGCYHEQEAAFNLHRVLRPTQLYTPTPSSKKPHRSKHREDCVMRLGWPLTFQILGSAV